MEEKHEVSNESRSMGWNSYDYIEGLTGKNTLPIRPDRKYAASIDSGFRSALHIDLNTDVQHNADSITHFEAEGYPTVSYTWKTAHPYLDVLNRV